MAGWAGCMLPADPDTGRAVAWLCADDMAADRDAGRQALVQTGGKTQTDRPPVRRAGGQSGRQAGGQAGGAGRPGGPR